MAQEPQRPGGAESRDASVGHAGEPHGSRDTRDLRREEGVGPAPQELDEREERFAGPRKAMGPPPEEEDGVPETTPEEG